jgi:hypothetical protein
MWDSESERFMIAAAEFADAGGIRTHASDWNPNMARFFPYRLRDKVYDLCGYLYHLNVLPGSMYYFKSQNKSVPMGCSSCDHNWSAHWVSVARGKRFDSSPRMYLTNAAYNFGRPRGETIRINEWDARFPAAYKAWLSGKNPTDSPEWKRGIFFGRE